MTIAPTRPVVAGVGLAAIRDAASAFRYRSDLPVRGRAAYVFGISQTGRFLRQFLYDGFNADESDRRVFDAVWAHIAGAARGSFNERFATPSQGDMFEPTQFPFADAEETDVDGSRAGLLSRYRPDQLPESLLHEHAGRVLGRGRAAALTHTSVDGTRDLVLPDNVRMYLLAGTQHGSAPFPPPTALAARASGLDARALLGQELSNPTPQDQRHAGAASRACTRGHPRRAAAAEPSILGSMTGRSCAFEDVKFPALPRSRIPAGSLDRREDRREVRPLPHLVPQVDADGNDLAGIRDPEVAVPLATTTGWNFRSTSVGNPWRYLFRCSARTFPFPQTRAVRESTAIRGARWRSAIEAWMTTCSVYAPRRWT